MKTCISWEFYRASLIADQLWSKNQALVSNGFLVNQKFTNLTQNSQS